MVKEQLVEDKRDGGRVLARFGAGRTCLGQKAHFSRTRPLKAAALVNRLCATQEGELRKRERALGAAHQHE